MNGKIDIRIDFNNTFNFSMQQNNKALINEMEITNLDEKDIGSFSIKIYSEPQFMYEWNLNVDGIKTR